MKVGYSMQEAINAIPYEVTMELFMDVIGLKTLLTRSNDTSMDHWKDMVYSYLDPLLKKYNYIYMKDCSVQNPNAKFIYKLYFITSKTQFSKEVNSKRANKDLLKELDELIKTMAVKIK